MRDFGGDSRMESTVRGWCAGLVAQIFNLLYSRIAFGNASERGAVSGLSYAPQSPTLRYSKVQLCATPKGTPGPLAQLFGSRYFRSIFPADRNPRIERVEFELRATGVKPEAANPLLSGVHTRGYLPHV